MNARFPLLFATFGLCVYAQSWSTFLDPSRAINWTSAGFTIPSYSTPCSTQPSLTANSSSAANANATSIQNALNSCDSTHNVVSIPSGTYYVAGFQFGYQGNEVLRGAGPKVTKIISTNENNCGGLSAGVCSIDANPLYNQDAQVLPPSGSQQCLWSGTNGTAGTYTQGATTINLTNCGGAPPLNQLVIMDQADDLTDTGGVYICDGNATNCTVDGTGSIQGRVIGGVDYAQQQLVYVTSVTHVSGGTYNITISPGVYFNNVRSSQNPGIWWSGFIQNTGVENMTIDGTSDTDFTVTMYDCYQCWVKNLVLLNGARASVEMYQSAFDVIRDSYFYQAQGHQSISYNIESLIASGFLVENNIFQQVTTPMTINAGAGGVVDYNYAIDNIAFSGYTWGAFSSHNAGNNMNLWEGNSVTRIQADNSWGSAVTQTYYRNMLTGWKSGNLDVTNPIILQTYDRGFNAIGNILGQPSYHNQYQTYATSATGGSGGSNELTSIYDLGWAFYGPSCGNGTNTNPTCDAKVFSTLMRWGNWDTVNAATQWNSTEASPAAVPYLNANFTSSYFGSLAQTLPNSLIYNSAPSWWGSHTWPAYGPDVSTGTVGICNGGTYAGAQATSSAECTGGSLTSAASAYASHVALIPAQDCYLNVMNGPPDGSGSALSFDASLCYSSSDTGLNSMTNLTSSVQ